jgi:hypothetical protein
MVAIRGHFDGKVIVPDEPVDLPRNQPLVLHVETAPQAAVGNGSTDFGNVLKQHAGSVEAPADWAEQHDHYLYGTPKSPSKAK